MLVFYFFAAIVIWLGILSLLGGFRFAAYVRGELARALPNFQPLATVFVPCRGVEAGLRENLAALLQQTYPAYEIVFVIDHEADPAAGVIADVKKLQPEVPTRLVIAGPAVDCGQKVHNLRTAVNSARPESVVFVFVDTDARPDANWLQNLIAPLADPQLGAATGYRWFISTRQGVASQLRAVWNGSIASALGENEQKNFCWGGSTAIRRSTFAELDVQQHWRGTVSDDFALTEVLHKAKRGIHFVPACLVASVDDITCKELFEFTNRQLKITRVYAAHLWKPLLVGSLLFCSVFFGGIALVIARAMRRLDYFLPLLLLLVIYLLGAAKALIRLRAVAAPLANYRTSLWASLPAHLLLWPFASALYLFNAIVAAFSRTISWRGITYELKSATEAVIIARGTVSSKS